MPQNWGRAFAIGIALNVAFVVIEVVYGLIANSSALLADAGHNAGDVLSLAFAWGAIRIATRKPTGKYTYGLRRSTILASMLNAILLLVAVGFILSDSIDKIQHPTPVAGMTVVLVAGIGFVINAITALLFMRGQHSDLNIKGAFLHMAADAAVSLGVVLAGLAIRYTGAYWIDPVVSFVIVVVIVYGTWGLFKDSVDLALDAVPKNVDIAKVHEYLEARPEVDSVHDLHVWGLSTTETALTVHLVAPGGVPNNFFSCVRTDLHDQFGISHATIQLETGAEDIICDCDCVKHGPQSIHRER